MSLVCSKKTRKTLIVTARPANGTKASSVWFYVNGKLNVNAVHRSYPDQRLGPDHSKWPSRSR